MNNHRDLEFNPLELLEVPHFVIASLADSLSARQTLVNQVKEACQTHGMFQIQNHGISNDVLTNAMTSAKEFFDLPTEELRALSGIKNSKRMLYTSSYAHALGMAGSPLYWRDALQLKVNTEVVADGWPTMPHSFGPNVWDFARSIGLLERELLSIISEGLGLSETYFDRGLCRAPHIVIDRYPKCPKPTMACGTPMHCDAGVLTISLLGDVPGTQVYRDGEWKQVKTSMNTLLVTVGHQLQVISNGIFKAPIHREVVNSERTRTTISRVSEPLGDYVVGPASEITRTNPALYKDFKYEDYLGHHVLEYANSCSILERYYMR